ncbi:MAG TPA: MmcQ/YjbR family DNA-binding protein [Thermoanaerobaculia bacterium]|jgi:hypothetical protein|nr:MmcQ/YjbR family DNA-binding protein [Thermoanaerobaculia bacterium]
MHNPLSTFDTVREIAFALPGVEEGTCYGTPAFRVRKKFLCRLKEDGETLVVKVDFDTPEVLLQADPAVFFTTPHYDGYPSVLVRLAAIQPEDLREVLETAWRIQAPKKLAALKP